MTPYSIIPTMNTVHVISSFTRSAAVGSHDYQMTAIQQMVAHVGGMVRALIRHRPINWTFHWSGIRRAIFYTKWNHRWRWPRGLTRSRESPAHSDWLCESISSTSSTFLCPSGTWAQARPEYPVQLSDQVLEAE